MTTQLPKQNVVERAVRCSLTGTSVARASRLRVSADESFDRIGPDGAAGTIQVNQFTVGCSTIVDRGACKTPHTPRYVIRMMSREVYGDIEQMCLQLLADAAELDLHAGESAFSQGLDEIIRYCRGEGA